MLIINLEPAYVWVENNLVIQVYLSLVYWTRDTTTVEAVWIKKNECDVRWKKTLFYEQNEHIHLYI